MRMIRPRMIPLRTIPALVMPLRARFLRVMPLRAKLLRLMLLLTACLFATEAMAVELLKTVRICTPAWDDYTQPDGTGLYHELWQEIFAESGIHIEVVYAPFKRCENSVLKAPFKRYDAYPAGYEGRGGLNPIWHLGIDLLTVAYRKGALSRWVGEGQLENKPVAWLRGYDFGKHVLKVPVREYEVSQIEQGLEMVSVGRVDFVLDYADNIRKHVEQLDLGSKIEIAEDVIIGPKYYMIFAKSAKGQELAEVWDRGMMRLYEAGKLTEMYKRYNDLAY